MATQVQLRRGTTAQHAGFTGAVGEITVDTDLDTIKVHDGSTAGGIRLARYDELGSSVSLGGNNTWTGTQTFRDNKFEITDDSDTTKKLTLQLSGITTGQTRVASVPDQDFTVAGINVKQTYTKQQTPMSGTLTDGATIDWNGDSNGQVVAVTLGGNRTMNAPTNIVQYAMYILRVSQDGIGSRTLTWNAAYKFGTTGAPTLTTTASKVDILSFLGGAGNTLEYLGIKKDAV